MRRLGSARVGPILHGSSPVVLDETPRWADGYEGWLVHFHDGPEDWMPVGDGGAGATCPGGATDREVLTAFARRARPGFSQGDSATALALGSTRRCDHGDRSHRAKAVMGASFPTERCPADPIRSFHRLDVPDP